MQCEDKKKKLVQSLGVRKPPGGAEPWCVFGAGSQNSCEQEKEKSDGDKQKIRSKGGSESGVQKCRTGQIDKKLNSSEGGQWGLLTLHYYTG